MSKRSRLIPLVAIAIVISSMGIARQVSASTLTSPATALIRHGNGSTQNARSLFFQGVKGTVSAITGSTLTVNSKNGTTYTVDASIAKIVEASTTATASEATLLPIEVTDVKVGDTVTVEGTLSGTTVSAKNILDGQWAIKHARHTAKKKHAKDISSTL